MAVVVTTIVFVCLSYNSSKSFLNAFAKTTCCVCLWNTLLKKLKITVYNFDNEPLNIDSVLVKGYNHDLTIRFTERGNYFLTYGNTKAKKPNYEISKFVLNFANKGPSTKIPALIVLTRL